MRYARPRIFCLAAARDAWVYARTLTLLLPQPPPLGLLAACSSLGLPHGRRTSSVPGRRPPRRCCSVFLLFSPVGTVLIGIGRVLILHPVTFNLEQLAVAPLLAEAGGPCRARDVVRLCVCP